MLRAPDVVPPIRGHHENWDGTGYPEGLAGDLIPLASRIIRFADTIDAMISERPYRAPMSEAQSCKTDEQIYVEMTEQRFSGVNRCC